MRDVLLRNLVDRNLLGACRKIATWPVNLRGCDVCCGVANFAWALSWSLSKFVHKASGDKLQCQLALPRSI